jgi:hypothetical protein
MDGYTYDMMMYGRGPRSSRERFNCVITLFDDEGTDVSLNEIIEFCRYVMDTPITDLYKEARKLVTVFNHNLGE